MAPGGLTEAISQAAGRHLGLSRSLIAIFSGITGEA
jgi:hypothetical protein